MQLPTPRGGNLQPHASSMTQLVSLIWNEDIRKKTFPFGDGHLLEVLSFEGCIFGLSPFPVLVTASKKTCFSLG